MGNGRVRILKGQIHIQIEDQMVDLELWGPVIKEAYEKLHPEDSPVWGWTFRRRCGWCGVQLRWWQLNVCRMCKAAIVAPWTTSPYPQKSRWANMPDRFRRNRATH